MSSPGNHVRMWLALRFGMRAGRATNDPRYRQNSVLVRVYGSLLLQGRVYLHGFPFLLLQVF